MSDKVCTNLEFRDGFCHCKIVDEFTNKPIHCETSKHSPCHECKKLWTTPPTKENMNIVLIEEIKKADYPEPPSLIRQAVNYVEAVVDQALFGVEVPEHILQERERICQSCPNYEDKHCKLCGCSLAGGVYQNKLKMSNQKCPDNPPRWDVYSPA